MQMMHDEKVLCLYHNDPDGQCSGAIVRRRLGKGVRFAAMEYGHAIPWALIEESDVVIVTDFSLPKEEMERIKQDTHLIWIDHHKTAIEAMMDVEVDGLRAIDRAGCVLTWQYFYPDESIPRGVQYIGERDIWTFVHEETKPFCEGLYQMNQHPKNDEVWTPLLDDDDTFVEKVVEEGELLLRARQQAIQRQVHGRGFEVLFEGHRTLAINQRGTGELGEYIRSLGYVIGYAYVQVLRTEGLSTQVTLYSEQIDVSEIAVKFGGGGHAGAAGFIFPSRSEPFPEEASVDWEPQIVRGAGDD